jgi:DNA-binding NarL/FixJ family response regulator
VSRRKPPSESDDFGRPPTIKAEDWRAIRGDFKLTRRESHAVGFVVQGHGNKQIAGLMETNQSTVKKQLSSAGRRMNARTRGEISYRVLEAYCKLVEKRRDGPKG